MTEIQVPLMTEIQVPPMTEIQVPPMTEIQVPIPENCYHCGNICDTTINSFYVCTCRKVHSACRENWIMEQNKKNVSYRSHKCDSCKNIYVDMKTSYILHLNNRKYSKIFGLLLILAISMYFFVKNLSIITSDSEFNIIMYIIICVVFSATIIVSSIAILKINTRYTKKISDLILV